MKKIALSAVVVMALGSVGANAIELYQDAKGQVFTVPGEGRTALGNYENVDKKSTALKSTTPKSKVKKSITIVNQDSPEFLLGKETHINMKFVPDDAPDMWFKAGVRIQGTLESKSTDYDDITKSDTTVDDAYLRRVRLEVAAGFGEHASFTMDLRNDKSNYGVDNEEGSFNVGDAYVKIKKPFDTSLVNFKLYRAKIDVSRTETVKSARVIAYDRPYVADAAAQYISRNRRAANVQMYGDYKKKIQYQIAAGSATNPAKVKDAMGNTDGGIDLSDQSFFYGGKIKLSPFDGWEELANTETYMGVGKHFTLGAAYWSVPTMEGKTGGAQPIDLSPSLINVEASAHYKGLMVQGEYFKFDDTVEDWSAATLNVGSSSGWYVTSEYVFSDFYYIAPFVRYESWDRFEGKDGYDSSSTMAGLNWYLRGNSTKVGIYYQKDTLGENIGKSATAGTNAHDVDILRVTSQWFF